MLLLINAFQAFDEFYNLLSNPGAGTYPPYARPPLVYLYYIALGRQQDFGHGSAGRGDPDADHRRRSRSARVALLGFGRRGAMAEVRPRGGPGGRVGATVLYGVLVVAAILFLVPFYLVVRNGLSTDLEISLAGLEVVPERPAVRATSPTCSTTGRAVRAQPAQLGDRLGACRPTGAVLIASMAGYGLARIPYRFANVVFVGDPGDADDPGRGDVRAELHHRRRARLAQHATRA